MSRTASRLAKLVILALGWLVAIATSPVSRPVEYTALEVPLSAGAEAPSTAVVDVLFEGAFIREPMAVCAFVWGPADRSWLHSYTDVGVRIRPLSTLSSATELTGNGDYAYLAEQASPLTNDVLYGCAVVTCEPGGGCGGRLAVTLTDETQPDASVDPDTLATYTVVIAAVTDATPGALPGRATVTLVETRP